MQTKRLLLDRAHLIEMVCQPDFYDACPAFAWLRENGLARAAEYKRLAATLCCGNDWPIIKPIVNGFFNHLRELSPADREQVRAYLTQKKRYIPRPLVIFYRSERTGKALRLQF